MSPRTRRGYGGTYATTVASLLILSVALSGRAASARPASAEAITLQTDRGSVQLLAAREHVGPGDAVIRCVVDAGRDWPEGLLVLRYEASGGWHAARMRPAGAGAGASGAAWEAAIPNAGRGSSVEYYVEIDTGGGTSQRIPAGAPRENLELTFKGKPNIPLLIAHVLAMLGGLACLLIGSICAIRFLRTGRALGAMRRLALLGAALLFIGSLLLGIVIEYQVFGTYWEGWPFGRDVTDTKTGLFLVLWVVLLLMRGRTIWNDRTAAGGLTDRTWARWLVALTALTLALYLIPHDNMKF